MRVNLPTTFHRDGNALLPVTTPEPEHGRTGVGPTPETAVRRWTA
jgi:hypothetical protein